MRLLLQSAVLLLVMTCSIHAQSEAVLVSFFESKSVVMKIDMPGTKDGVPVYPQRSPQLDARTYGDRIKTFGVALKQGDSVMITKVKVKDDHIEFQLGGGGYGTASDEQPTPIVAKPLEKSQSEKNLESDLDKETDADEKRRIQRRLDDMRDDRERQDRRNKRDADQATKEKMQRIAENRLKGGSRFNIIYSSKIPSEVLTPQSVMAALSEYVDFTSIGAAAQD